MLSALPAAPEIAARRGADAGVCGRAGQNDVCIRMAAGVGLLVNIWRAGLLGCDPRFGITGDHCQGMAEEVIA